MLPCCSESWSIHLHKPSGSSTVFLGYDLCSLKFFSLVVSFGFIPIIDVMLFILFTMHLRFSIEIANTFSGSLRAWAYMVLSICFANYLLKKGLNKSCIFVLVFFGCFSSVNIVLFKQFYHVIFKVRPWYENNLWYLATLLLSIQTQPPLGSWS